MPFPSTQALTSRAVLPGLHLLYGCPPHPSVSRTPHQAPLLLPWHRCPLPSVGLNIPCQNIAIATPLFACSHLLAQALALYLGRLLSSNIPMDACLTSFGSDNLCGAAASFPSLLCPPHSPTEIPSSSHRGFGRHLDTPLILLRF